MVIPFRAFISRRTLLTIRNFLRSIHNSLVSVFPIIMNTTTQSSSDDTPPFDPSQPSVPIAYPIKTLEDLESRSYFNSFHFPFNIASVPDRTSLPDRPRILVCHDMAGGYLDDKWIQGGTNSDAYTIWHWNLIDVFVYFSHTFVTLPPPCWTNAAHKHGVKVLGTLITEWEEGSVISNKLLLTMESAHMYAERLAELAVALGFDGWLINMEVDVNVKQLPNLKVFISHLTNTMHSSKPGSLVIWYDSVTIGGKLDWQDQLNASNKPFFDICDGIFVNYTWKEDYPKASAAVAGDRKFDVYMGIDVFGRNTYGGGQWETNIALDVIKKGGVSAAIFAPGWVYETKQPPDFQTAQNRWWSLVEKSWGTLQNYPRSLPFYSNFDQGRGYHISTDGVQVFDSSWNNINFQSFQPFLESPKNPTPDTIQVCVDFKEVSYSGGGNITFKGTLEDNASFTARLFRGELHSGDLPLHFTFSVKTEGNSLIGLSLVYSSVTKEKKSVLLASWESDMHTTNLLSSEYNKVIMPHRVTKPEATPGWVIQESRIGMNGYTLEEIHAVCYRSKSDPRSEVSVDKEYFAVLGHLTIKTSENDDMDFPPSTSWLVEGQYIRWSNSDTQEGSKTVGAKVLWKLKDGDASMFPQYNIYVEKFTSHAFQVVEEREFLGVAKVGAFYVSDLVVPNGTSFLKFIVQVCGVDGTCQKLDDSPSLLLRVED